MDWVGVCKATGASEEGGREGRGWGVSPPCPSVVIWRQLPWRPMAAHRSPSWLLCPLQAAGLGVLVDCQPDQATLPDTLRQGEGALHCRLWSHFPLPLTRYSGSQGPVRAQFATVMPPWDSIDPTLEGFRFQWAVVLWCCLRHPHPSSGPAETLGCPGTGPVGLRVGGQNVHLSDQALGRVGLPRGVWPSEL